MPFSRQPAGSCSPSHDRTRSNESDRIHTTCATKARVCMRRPASSQRSGHGAARQVGAGPHYQPGGGWLPGWLAGMLAGWLAGLLASWQAG